MGVAIGHRRVIESRPIEGVLEGTGAYKSEMNLPTWWRRKSVRPCEVNVGIGVALAMETKNQLGKDIIIKDEMEGKTDMRQGKIRGDEKT